jgi:hypothetical protein
MIDRIASATALVFSAGVTAAGTSVAVSSASPYAWLIPIVCGCLAALLVRGIVVSKPTRLKKAWVFEALVTALSVLVTGVAVADQHFGVMSATMTGIGLGGLGVGIITIGKTWAGTVITNLAKSVLSVSPDDKN